MLELQVQVCFYVYSVGGWGICSDHVVGESIPAVHHCLSSQWGTTDTEIKVTPGMVGTQGCYGFLLSKPGVDQKIALHAVPAVRTSIHVISAFPINSASFFPTLLQS